MKLIHKRSRYDSTKFEVGLNVVYDREKVYGFAFVIPFWIKLFPTTEYYVPGCGYGEIYCTKSIIKLTAGRQIYCLRVGATKSFAWGNSWYDMRVTCERIRLPFGKQEIVIAKNEVLKGEKKEEPTPNNKMEEALIKWNEKWNKGEKE